MNKIEKQATFSLALIFSFRMLGLFMILPVFAIYAQGLAYSTPLLIGLALGVYGFTQACLQIPFGMMSDKIGRKPIIVAGLILFAIGSMVAANSDSIYGVIAGRALQGAGAIGSTILAFVADLTREEERTKAMAFIGMSIGSSFLIAMVLGTVLNQWIGVKGIFWFTALLALGGIGILYALVPKSTPLKFHRDTELEPAQFKLIIRNKELLRLNAGILISHACLTALFIAIPIMLGDQFQLAVSKQWLLYAPVLIFAFFSMLPFIILAEKKAKMKPVLIGAIAVLALAELILNFSHSSLVWLILGLWLFFAAFTLLEATLPSLVSKIAPSASKGTATGVYSCCQFFGIFLGGALGGWLFGHGSILAIFLFIFTLTLIWLGIASTMRKPKQVATHLVSVGEISSEKAARLKQLLLSNEGIIEVTITCDDGIAYVKFDSSVIGRDSITKLINEE